MKEEYWFNVYDKPLYCRNDPYFNQGAICDSYEQTKHVTKIMSEEGYRTLYRIHVRLK
jgi:hypothetical protein